MEYITLLDSDINSKAIWDELYPILVEHNLHHQQQVSLTSLNGDSWIESVGRLSDLDHPEKYYSTVHYALKNTLTEQLILRYKSFYRWRLLCIPPKQTYSIHRDSLNPKLKNIRIHIPLVTNDDAFMCFLDTMPENGSTSNVKYYNLKENNSYLADTSDLHTAVNYGKTHRYHIVGVKYESRDNRAQ